jgi:hypothetical protein
MPQGLAAAVVAAVVGVVALTSGLGHAQPLEAGCPTSAPHPAAAQAQQAQRAQELVLVYRRCVRDGRIGRETARRGLADAAEVCTALASLASRHR